MNTDPNDAAFPTTSNMIATGDGTMGNLHEYGSDPQQGLTKLEEFAKTAMCGMLSHPGCNHTSANTQISREVMAFVARDAVFMARAMIDELNKPIPPLTEGAS